MSGLVRKMAVGLLATLATSELIASAQAGDSSAFQQLTEPHRRELLLHCYRLLGSFSEAEDALQETLLAAWQAFGTFEQRASLRSWLYRIATNRCLNERRLARRRPAKNWDVPGVVPPPPSRLGEVVWLEPYPDILLPTGPEDRYEQSETVALAFVTALQSLPPQQLAALILCDILGFAASEAAEFLDSTIDSVNSAIKRARANLTQRQARAAAQEPPPLPDSSAEQAITSKFVHAWESADVDALVRLLTDDVFVSMPPIALEYEGRELAERFFVSLFEAGRRFELVPTRANGQPAFAAYLRTDTGPRPGVGVHVIELSGDRISALTRFEPQLLSAFGLPLALPAR